MHIYSIFFCLACFTAIIKRQTTRTNRSPKCMSLDSGGKLKYIHGDNNRGHVDNMLTCYAEYPLVTWGTLHHASLWHCIQHSIHKHVFRTVNLGISCSSQKLKVQDIMTVIKLQIINLFKDYVKIASWCLGQVLEFNLS